LQMQDCFNDVVDSIWVIITRREQYFTIPWQPPSGSEFPKAWHMHEKNRCSPSLIHNSSWTKNFDTLHCKCIDCFLVSIFNSSETVVSVSEKVIEISCGDEYFPTDCKVFKGRWWEIQKIWGVGVCTSALAWV
jgi:hypothetical protein